MAMFRLARRTGTSAHLLVSARAPVDLIYAGELDGDDATVLYTRVGAPSDPRPPGRLTADDIRPRPPRGCDRLHLRISPLRRGSDRTPLDAGAAVDVIRIERFGPSG